MILGWKHAALECTDLKRSMAFYQDCFGMQAYLNEHSDWAMLSLEDSYLSLVPVPMLNLPGAGGGSHPGHLGLLLRNPPSVHALHEKLEGMGVRVGKVLTHRDGSQGFYLKDPDGNSLECIFVPHRSYSKPRDNELWVLFAHGSRDPQWSKPFETILESLRLHIPSVTAELAFLEAEPSLEAVLQAHPDKKVKVFPLFFSSGGAHMKRDLPELIARLSPGREIECMPVIGETLLVQEAVVAAGVRQAETLKI